MQVWPWTAASVKRDSVRISVSLCLLFFVAGGISIASHGQVRAPAPPGPGDPAFKRRTVDETHGILLLQAAPDGLIEELYDYYLLVSERAVTGEISPSWAAYLYVNYFRDAMRDRPDGVPRRSREQVAASLEESVQFFYIRKRPEAGPSYFGAWVWQAAPPQ